MDWDSVKGFLGALAIWLVLGGFAWLVVNDHQQGRDACPGVYSDFQGCAVPR